MSSRFTEFETEHRGSKKTNINCHVDSSLLTNCQNKADIDSSICLAAIAMWKSTFLHYFITFEDKNSHEKLNYFNYFCIWMSKMHLLPYSRIK
jgi:hypothetical protein